MAATEEMAAVINLRMKAAFKCVPHIPGNLQLIKSNRLTIKASIMCPVRTYSLSHQGRTCKAFPDSTLRGNGELGDYNQVEVALGLYLCLARE